MSSFDYHGGGIYSRHNDRDGRTYYFIRYTGPDGRRHKEKAGTRKRAAEQLLEQRQTEIRIGRWKDPRTARPKGMTFGDLADTFLKEHTGRRRSHHYPVTLRRIRREFESVRLTEITRTRLELYRRKLETEPRRKGKDAPKGEAPPPLSPTTILKLLRTMHRVLRFAVQRELIEFNPAADMEKPSVEQHRVAYLTPDQFQSLEGAAPPWVRPILLFAVSTGMRLKEVTGLTWGDVDKAAGVVHVPMDSKTGTRAVPLSAAARAVLDATTRRLRCPYVFHDDAKEPILSDRQRARVSQATGKAARSVGIEEGRAFHLLRHTAASWMVQRGVSLYEVQTILGHSSPALTQRYAHLAPGFGGGAAAAIDAVFTDQSQARRSLV